MQTKFWLLGSGCWLLGSGCWLLVARCWLLVAGCLLLVAGNGFSQKQDTTFDFRMADSITYDLYMQSQWEPLKQAGNNMLREGADYQYLRARLGTAYYATANYLKSETHFSRATELNPYDEYSQSMLYYALNATLKQAEAGHLLTTMPESLKQRIEKRKPFRLLSAHADLGYVFRGQTKGLDIKQLTGPDSLYGEEQIYQSNPFLDAGFRLQLNPGLLFYLGGQHIVIPAHNRFVYNEYSLQTDTIIRSGDSLFYYYQPMVSQADTIFSNTVRQQSLYAQFQYAPSTRMLITAGFHLLDIQREYTTSAFQDVFLSDTTYLNLVTGDVNTIEIILPAMQFNQALSGFTDWSLNAGLQFHGGYLSPDIGFAVSRINQSRVAQVHGGLQLLPLGNLQLYSYSRIALIMPHGDRKLVLKQTAGGRIAGPVWFEASVIAGDLSLYADQSGYIVYNMPDVPALKTEAVLGLELGKHLLVTIRHQFQQADREYYWFESLSEKLITDNYNIQSHTIIGGIKWTF